MANNPQRSFASGELTPALWARTDVAKYATGLRTCRNFIIQPTGGANLRPGFDFVDDLTGNAAVRLIRFIFNNAQAYILAFGSLECWVYQNGALITTLVTPYSASEVEALNYTQSGDVMTLVHLNHPPMDLKRTSATTFTISPVTFTPSISAPVSLHVVPGILGPGRVNRYFVSAIDAVTGQESAVVVGDAHSLHTPTSMQPDNLSWPAVAGASAYRIYSSIDDPPDVSAGSGAASGWIATVTQTSFANPGLTPDFTQAPIVPFTGLQSAGNYPSVVGYYQQRRLYANTTNEPEKVWASRTGAYYDFSVSYPLTDDNPVTFVLANSEVTEVRHLLDLGKLIVGTEGAEWLIEGDANGILTPSAINARVGSYNGCAKLLPVKVGNSVLYIQALGNKILELKTNIQYGYYTFTGKDVTVFSQHLFNGYTALDWDYAQIPNYITWVVRSDGKLLGFTYLDDQQLSAWYWFDTVGTFEQVCVLPENGEHRLYAIISRTVDGLPKRYLERMRPMSLASIDAASFLDAALEYDGRSAGAGGTTLTLTGSDWLAQAQLTLTASVAEFGSAQAGDARFLRDASGTQVVATIASITSPTVAVVNVDVDVPVDMQAVAITDWDRAVKYLGNLLHLDGKTVGVFADEQVVASPNNPTVATVTVTAGIVTLDKAYAHIVVGLPYLGDLWTLDIDTPQGPSVKESNIVVNAVGTWLQASRGVFVGREAPTGTDATQGLKEMKVRQTADPPANANPLLTDFVKTNISSRWDNNGRVVIRQVDPVPLNVLAVIPFGFLPEGA